jgi:MFS family permease
MNYYQKNLRHNLMVNLIDGGFFGAALGFASFVTVIPLFVSQFTNSAVLIGLIPAIHSVGWQLPQLFIANRVSRLTIFKPTVILLTIQERLPFLALALVAWFSPSLGIKWSLILIFALLIWQGLGGGFTANPWQSMIAKIIPGNLIGTFFGVQSAAANLLASLTAITAGFILYQQESPLDYTLCFLLASGFMAISWVFLTLTREDERQIELPAITWMEFRAKIKGILKWNRNFRWFLITRMLSQFAAMGFAFYTVYVVRELGMRETTIGIMTGILLATQILANPVMGWLGDRRGHRLILEIGISCSVASAVLAWWAPSAIWFYPVFILTGLANVAMWTIPMAMTIQFCQESERPAYIGMANTLIAPCTFLAPLFGGWLADFAGFSATFITSAIFGLTTVGVLHFAVRDPRNLPSPDPIPISESKRGLHGPDHH